ncbi:beta-galactosidase [Anaeromicrobium sediminis]|uniref:Beta-galactosidase n=1 Tax=Anaeromicrobium sediminis TaxID=1478221 RepID=A0A267MLJ8_9FIRM|nr:beta-galactosidase [Anaeromicrobium sediminis]PAB60282.1 beta-galactosidase [Anaeromicrobium sediminis]
MYLGVDYYPEHWDTSMIDEDLTRIKEMGSNIIRIGEFAWHLMEKREGEYDFSYFDMVIKKAKEYDLKIMFGTPTATFPAWLAKKHPSILSKDELGHTRVFGGRRQYCFNSKEYMKYTKIIVEKLVSHYKNEESIISWQVDNEFGHEGSDMCYCDQCEEKFIEYLKDKYEIIDKFNEVCGTIFWGQTYNDFSEIPLPKPTITTHNPTLKLEHARFRSYSINKFGKEQIEHIRKFKGEKQEITHNFFGGFFDRAYDQNVLSEDLDFVSYDNYPVWGGLEKPIESHHIAMTLDYIRGLKNENYWIVEEIMGAQGHDFIGYLPRPNQAKMWAYQAMAHGCKNMLFFRWRGMTRGAEQFCLGIIDQHNEKGRKYEEVKSFMTHIKGHEELVKSPIKAQVALLYDFDNIWSWNYQRQSSEFNFTKEVLRLYKPFYDLNTNMDVISIKKSFKGYKVLVVPVMSIIDEELAKKFENFVKDGGSIVFSFRSGIKDRNNNLNFKNPFPSHIRQMTGIKIEESESLGQGGTVEIIGMGEYNGKKGKCEVWRDLISLEGAKELYRYDDKFYNTKSCITENEYESGKVYYVGAGVDNSTIGQVVEKIVIENNIEHIKSQEGLEVYMRHLNDERWFFITNHTDEELDYNNTIIEPYESKIIKG